VSYVVIGFVVGALTAYSGVGAGALTTPLLVLLLGVGADVAIGSDLLFALGTRLTALIAHVQARTIQWPLVAALSAGGVPGALAGVAISAHVHAVAGDGHLERLLRLAVGAALVLAAAAIVFNRRLGADATAGTLAMPFARVALVGAFVGLTVSVTSIGAGSLTLPLMLWVVPAVAVRRMVGTDIAFAVIVLVPSLLGHWRIGDVNAKLAGLLLAGSIPGVILGSHLVAKLPERWFRNALAGVFLVVSAALVR
jgi:uncharacterized membrane protein YfcA